MGECKNSNHDLPSNILIRNSDRISHFYVVYTQVTPPFYPLKSHLQAWFIGASWKFLLRYFYGYVPPPRAVLLQLNTRQLSMGAGHCPLCWRSSQTLFLNLKALGPMNYTQFRRKYIWICGMLIELRIT